MRAKQIRTGFYMISKMLIRQKIVIVLLVVLPATFLSIVEFTTSERVLPFQLASINEKLITEISEKSISAIFLSMACAGFIISFLALNLIQKNREANKRLIICGYRPTEILIALVFTLLITTLLIAFYIGFLTNTFFKVHHPFSFTLSLTLIGFVYGCYGLAVGSVVNGELEGILLIVLLVNIDAGWLQNPLFYAEAQNQIIIKSLPAYYPSQASITTAFTDYSPLKSILSSLLYGALFLIIAMYLFFTKMRIKK